MPWDHLRSVENPVESFGGYTASKGTNVALDPHRRPFDFTMRWALMALALIALIAVIVAVVLVVA